MIANKPCSRTSAEGMLLALARSRSMFSRSLVATAVMGSWTVDTALTATHALKWMPKYSERWGSGSITCGNTNT